MDTQKQANANSSGQPHKQAILLYFDPAQIEEIDRVWHKEELKSRSETVRMLVGVGLDEKRAVGKRGK